PDASGSFGSHRLGGHAAFVKQFHKLPFAVEDLAAMIPRIVDDDAVPPGDDDAAGAVEVARIAAERAPHRQELPRRIEPEDPVGARVADIDGAVETDADAGRQEELPVLSAPA